MNQGSTLTTALKYKKWSGWKTGNFGVKIIATVAHLTKKGKIEIYKDFIFKVTS